MNSLSLLFSIREVSGLRYYFAALARKDWEGTNRVAEVGPNTTWDTAEPV